MEKLTGRATELHHLEPPRCSKRKSVALTELKASPRRGKASTRAEAHEAVRDYNRKYRGIKSGDAAPLSGKSSVAPGDEGADTGPSNPIQSVRK